MICPKCEIGNIRKVMMKKTGDTGFICDYCETFWSQDEEIKLGSGRPFAGESGDNDLEFVLEEAEEKDQEHRDARYTKIK